MPSIDPKAIAAARRQRTRRIRKRIAVLASTAFIAIFGGITVQMASGHDPVLTAGKPATSTQTSTTSSSTTSSGDDATAQSSSTDDSSSSSATASGSSSQSSSPSAVTTSQS